MYNCDKEAFEKFKKNIVYYTNKHTNGKIASMLLKDDEFVHDAIIVCELPSSKRRTLDKEFADLVKTYKKQLITFYGRQE